MYLVASTRKLKLGEASKGLMNGSANMLDIAANKREKNVFQLVLVWNQDTANQGNWKSTDNAKVEICVNCANAQSCFSLKQSFWYGFGSSCRPIPALSASDHRWAHRPQRAPQVLFHPAVVEPVAWLPGGLGQTHWPEHEGWNPAGIYAEAILFGGDGRCALQARGNSKSHRF